jgi:Ulp1 family protease
MEEDPTYLSYKNILLRQSDVDCLNKGKYLNDMCISFFYQFLNERHMKDENRFILLDPASVSLLFFEDDMDDLNLMFSPMNLSQRDFVFMPINDNTDRFQVGGGDHWALLVYQKVEDKFFYLDSMRNFIKNTDYIAKKFRNLLISNTEQEIETESKINLSNTLDQKYQENTYDCGVFVMEFTEILLDYIVSNNFTVLTSEFINDLFKKKINQFKVTKKRDEIKNIINKLRHK